MFGYVILIGSGLPFLLAVPARRRLSLWTWTPLVTGAPVALYTLATFGKWGAIRVDLLALMAVVLASNALGALGLSSGLLRRPAATPSERAALSLALLGALGFLGYAAYEWIALERHSRDLAERQHIGHNLLLDAKFADRESFRIAFGSLDAADPAHRPFVGYWRNPDPDAYYTRLVLTADLATRFLFSCGFGQCERGPVTLALTDDPSAPTKSAVATFVQGEMSWRLTISPLADGRLDATIERTGAAPVSFVLERASLPPVSNGPHEVVHLGDFSHIEELPNHIAMTELKLWRSGERLFGHLCRATPVRGGAFMLFPELLDPIDFDPADGTFAFDTRRGRFEGRFVGDRLSVAMPGARGVRRRVTFERRSRVDDVRFRLAPLTSYRAWRRWADTVVPFPHYTWSAAAWPRAVD